MSSHALFEWLVQEGIDLRKGWELHFKLGKGNSILSLVSEAL